MFPFFRLGCVLGSLPPLCSFLPTPTYVNILNSCSGDWETNLKKIYNQEPTGGKSRRRRRRHVGVAIKRIVVMSH